MPFKYLRNIIIIARANSIRLIPESKLYNSPTTDSEKLNLQPYRDNVIVDYVVYRCTMHNLFMKCLNKTNEFIKTKLVTHSGLNVDFVYYVYSIIAPMNTIKQRKQHY